MKTYIFQDQLQWSEGTIDDSEDIPAFLLRCIPLAVQVSRASVPDDKKGIDYWVTLQSGRRIGVDVKIRKEDFSKKGHDDVALETWSVIEKKIIGWSRDRNKQTDFILWLWKDTRRCMLVPFPWLCGVFEDHWEAWRTQYQTAIQCSTSMSSKWHSECTYVPRKVLWQTFYTTYGGALA